MRTKVDAFVWVHFIYYLLFFERGEGKGLAYRLYMQMVNNCMAIYMNIRRPLVE